MTDDRCEQMAFSFFQDDEVKTVKKTSIADQEFDTEEDALFALLGSHTDDTQLPPEDSASGEQFFSAPEKAVETVAEAVAETEAVAVGIAAEEKDEAEIERAVAALEQEFGLNNDIADLTQEIVDTVVDIEQEIEAEEEAPVIIRVKKKNIFPPLTEQTLRRAALGFLASLKPDMVGINFASGIGRIKVDAGAAFFGSGRTPVVNRTIAVVTCIDRNKCWIDASVKADLLQMLSLAQTEKAALEAELKVKEPDLKDDSLFPETQIWDFSRARSRKYHSCLKKIEKLEYSIYHGSKFERMMYEKLADEFYLVVPAGLIAADELPEEWGLVYIAEDFFATVIRPAKACDCPQEQRTAFALRSVCEGGIDTLFVNGISTAPDHTIRFHVPPKRRKPYTL